MNGKVPTVEILGVRVHNISTAETLTQLEAMALSGSPHHVMTVNPEFIMLAQENEEFRSVLSRVSLALPDGIGVLWASRMLGSHLQERVTGVDTVKGFSAIAANRGIRLFLLGGAPGVAESVASRLKHEYPNLMIAGTYAGSPSLAEEDEI